MHTPKVRNTPSKIEDSKSKVIQDGLAKGNVAVEGFYPVSLVKEPEDILGYRNT